MHFPEEWLLGLEIKKNNIFKQISGVFILKINMKK